MYSCKYCGAMFDAATCRQEIDGYDENDREIVMQTFTCPFCGDDCLEWFDDEDDDAEEIARLDRMAEERREWEEMHT